MRSPKLDNLLVPKKTFVALGMYLKNCPYLTTLGVRPQFSLYSQEEQNLIRSSPIVFFPTGKYIPLFQAVGKPTFPSSYSYYFKRKPFLQWTLASYFNLPRLKTRCYKRHTLAKTILETFSLPLRILKPTNNLHQGIVAKTERDLETILKSVPHMVLVQEIQNIIASVTLVFIFYEYAGFKGEPLETKIPEAIIELSHNITRKAHLDDISIRWVLTEEGWLFGGMGFSPGTFYTDDYSLIDRRGFLCDRIKEIAIEGGLLY
ncbi:MAG: hypothetical protein N2260_01310 [Syntrophobacterales bacterium]|nr:hypothetical protein [Syntrophobacterales bacterium]